MNRKVTDAIYGMARAMYELNLKPSNMTIKLDVDSFWKLHRTVLADTCQEACEPYNFPREFTYHGIRFVTEPEPVRPKAFVGVDFGTGDSTVVAAYRGAEMVVFDEVIDAFEDSHSMLRRRMINPWLERRDLHWARAALGGDGGREVSTDASKNSPEDGLVSPYDAIRAVIEGKG